MLKEVHLTKSHIRETKHLSTDADSSTNTRVGWTKNTQKPNFFYAKKIIQNAKTQKYAKISDTPFDQRSLIHREAWFPGVPTHFFEKRKKSPKTQKLAIG